MPADGNEKSGFLLGSITRLIDNAANDGGLDNLTNVLALLCIFSIVNRGQYATTQASATASGSGGPGVVLQKLLGDLGKGDGPSGDALMSLLPLLNSPQIKSKLNPANIATVLSLINNFSGANEKHEPEKPEKKTPDVKDEQAATAADPLVAATKPVEPLKPEAETADSDHRGLGRYLNWKSNF